MCAQSICHVPGIVEGPPPTSFQGARECGDAGPGSSKAGHASWAGAAGPPPRVAFQAGLCPWQAGAQLLFLAVGGPEPAQGPT